MRKNKARTRLKTNSSNHPIKPTLLALAIAQALAFQAAQAASIEVTSNLDDGTECTLREAIATVNAGADLLNGCVLTGDPLWTNDTITLSPAVAGQTITLAQGELEITKDVSINPGGVNTTIDGNQASRVMSIENGDTPDLSVTMDQLTITDGDSGGAIHMLGRIDGYYGPTTASLTLTNSTVSGNGGNGIDAAGSRGPYNGVVNLTLTDTTVSDNSGRGISLGYLGSLTLLNSTVSGNGTGSAASGIHVYYAGASLANSTVSGNNGEGIYLFVSQVGLTNSTVSNNFGGWGGIFGIYSSASLMNSTVSGNTGDSGGGITIDSASLKNSTVTGNTGGNAGIVVYDANVSLSNSIVANNTVFYGVPGNRDCYSRNYYGPVDIPAGPDTISTTVCGSATIADPLLGPLADNGGPTQTHALLAGSPAIDNATAAGATATDQRGIAAVGVRDSGAYEFTAVIETMGRPSIDRSADTGIFIWENEPNNWVAHVVSGDMPRIVDIDVNSTQALSNVQQVNIEADDVFTILPNGLDLSLDVKAPWLDGVNFTVQDGSSTCISTTNTDVPIYVGPNRVEVGSSFDLETLSACETGPDIETMGRPDIDRSADTGIFVWENQPNDWVTHVVSGDMSRIVDIDVNSTQALSNVQQVNIEADDVFTVLPNGLDLSLNVKAPWLDGANFTVQYQSSTCISTTNTDVPIYVGPNRVEVGRSFDLNTLTACESGPDIETMGKPNIDRSTDTGIFIWENQPNDWVSHVVSGDMQRIIEVDVNSSDALSDVQEINIEASDVFTVLPNGLDLSLNVKAPWLDGFKFSEQIQANTCVSTTSDVVSIYVGPDRVQIGNSIDLKTLISCP